MTVQNYCMVDTNTNVCDNVVLWDGDTATWQPPANYLMLVQASTLAKNWAWDENTKTWSLAVVGVGGVGYLWGGTYLVSNQPEPPILVPPSV
jgi:hypothetical protein